MQIIGIVILVLAILWLFLHKKKNKNYKDNKNYNDGIAEGISWLPQLAKHYVGID